MFYQEIQIKSYLNCKKCNKIYSETNLPKILPCGHNICSDCEKILKINQRIKCRVCSEDYLVSNVSLPKNLVLFEILTLTPNEIHRSNQVEELKKSIIQIDNIVVKIENKLNNGIDTIKEKCLNLRNQVQLETEIKIQQINSINKSFINEIDSYEKECCAKFLNEKPFKKNDVFNQLEEAKKSASKWRYYLNEFKIDDDVVRESHEEATSLVADLQGAEPNLTNFIFNDNLLTFEANQTQLTKASLGALSSQTKDSVILNFQQKCNLEKLFEYVSMPKWTLLYRGSTEKFNARTFYSIMESQYEKSLLLLIKSCEHEIFGGFAVFIEQNLCKSNNTLSLRKKNYAFVDQEQDCFGSLVQNYTLETDMEHGTPIYYNNNPYSGFLFKMDSKNCFEKKSYIGEELRFNKNNGNCFGSNGIYFEEFNNLLGSFYYASAFNNLLKYDTKYYSLSEIEVFTLN